MKRRTFLQRLLAAPVALPIAAKAAALPAAAPWSGIAPKPSLGELQTMCGQTIAEVRSITFKGLDAVNHNHGDGFKTFMLGMKKPGSISATVIWDAEDTTHVVPFAKLPPI